MLRPEERPPIWIGHVTLHVNNAALEALGLEPSEISIGSIHRSFTVESPSGHTITFNSDHTSSLPV